MSIESIINYSREEKVQQFLLLLKDPDVQPIFRMYIENILATSDLNILKRLSDVETALGLNNFGDFEEEHETTIPEKLSMLEEKISNVTKIVDPGLVSTGTIKPELVNRKLVNPPQSVTDIRADFLIEYMELNTEPIPDPCFANLELLILDSKKFRFFIEKVLPEQYRPKHMKNLRKLKRDIFERAAERHEKVMVDKSEHGNKELRLIVFREKNVKA